MPNHISHANIVMARRVKRNAIIDANSQHIEWRGKPVKTIGEAMDIVKALPDDEAKEFLAAYGAKFPFSVSELAAYRGFATEVVG